MRFDTELEGGFGEVDDADGRIVQSWGPGTSLDCKPDLEGVFGSQFVESEGGGEAQNSSGTLFATSSRVSLADMGASFARYRP